MTVFLSLYYCEQLSSYRGALWNWKLKYSTERNISCTNISIPILRIPQSSLTFVMWLCLWRACHLVRSWTKVVESIAKNRYYQQLTVCLTFIFSRCQQGCLASQLTPRHSCWKRWKRMIGHISHIEIHWTLFRTDTDCVVRRVLFVTFMG